MPSILKCPEFKPCPPCEPGSGPKCPDPARHRLPTCPDVSVHKRVLCGDPDCIVCPDPSHHEKTLCDSPECDKGATTIYQGDPIALAYRLGFSLTAANEMDEIDLKVCFQGNECVFGGRKKGKFMWWPDLRKGGFFGKPRLWNELVLAEKRFQPGTYTCYGRVSCKSTNGNQSKMELVVATKKKNKPKNVATTVNALECGNEWVKIGRFKVLSNYTITKL